MRVNVTPAGGEPAITSFLIEVDDDGDANVFDNRSLCERERGDRGC